MHTSTKISSYLHAYIILITLVFTYGCSKDPNADIQDIKIAVDFARVDQMMYQASLALIDSNSHTSKSAVYNQHLKKEQRFFCEFMAVPNEQCKDEALALELGSFLQDKAVYQLLDTIQQTFPEDEVIFQPINHLLKRLKLHFPQAPILKIRTHITGYPPRINYTDIDQVLVTENYISLGLHYFMGKELAYYPMNIPQFIRRRFETEYMETAVALELARGLTADFQQKGDTKLVDHIIYEGIKCYVASLLTPNVPDSILLSYTTKQMEWAKSFEKNIYNELIPRLYKNELVDLRNYIAEKPYTTHLSDESAPRLGVYMGLQVVRSYMKNHSKESIQDMVARTDYAAIFKKSKYKP